MVPVSGQTDLSISDGCLRSLYRSSSRMYQPLVRILGGLRKENCVISHPKFAVLLAKGCTHTFLFSVSETVSNPKCILISSWGEIFVRKRQELENFRTGNRSVRLDGGERLFQTAGLSVALSPSSSLRPHSSQTAISSQEEHEELS
ncbi:hypothetical protein RvY_14169-1 [Ramazzottius varieornatus]|uniref:Uncharacterized protein n=1 Tax=Ramazzottius varieornatus TaxID=947166 RepID=A0A1D1VYU8_RAMVA|nr:hypothetical protein RvY_14169-1 [Ramazzottius varieornatus]